MSPLQQSVHKVMKLLGFDRWIHAHKINYWLEVRQQRGHPVLGDDATNRWLGELISSGRPAAVGKLGSSECWTLAWHLRMPRFYKYTWCPPSFGELDLAEQSGVFPKVEEVFHRFAEL